MAQAAATTDTFKLVVTLIVMAYMIIMFLINKFPYGVTTMTCAVILGLTGVITPTDVFAGFSNTTLVLVACMFCIAGSLAKTSLVEKIKQKMAVIQRSKGTLLLIVYCLIVLVLTQLMGQSAVMSIMIVVVTTLDDTADTCQSRVLFLTIATIAAWFGRFPVGMGAALPFSTNAFYEAMVTDESQLLGLFDIMKAGLIPSILLTIYSIVFYKNIERTKLDTESDFVVNKKAADGKPVSTISKKQENIIYAVFVAIMIAFCFSKQLGQYLYLLPAAAVLVFIYTGVYTKQEAVRILTGENVWMIAGILVMSSALVSSGAGVAIGNFILGLLGENPTGLKVMFVFGIATAIMTNFLSNSTTLGVMSPIAASTALAGGFSPKPLIVCIFLCSCLAICLPTGSSSCMIGYSVGRFNPVKNFKFTIPYMIIGVISSVFSCNLFFPLYG